MEQQLGPTSAAHLTPRMLPEGAQEALGVSRPVCTQQPPSPPSKPDPLGQIADLLHNVSAVARASNLTLATKLRDITGTVHQGISGDVTGDLAALRTIPIQTPTAAPSANLTCHPQPAPFYTTNFVRNGSVNGEYVVTQPALPPVPPFQKRRSMAEAAHVAAAHSLDSTIADGSVVTYVPYANGTLDGTNLYYAFYAAYTTPSVTVFRLGGCCKHLQQYRNKIDITDKSRVKPARP